jgi:stage III sporulation protein AE
MDVNFMFLLKKCICLIFAGLIVLLVGSNLSVGADQLDQINKVGQTSEENKNNSKINLGDIINKQLDTIDFSQVNNSYKSFDGNDILKDIDFQSGVCDIARGKQGIIQENIGKIKNSLYNVFMQELKRNAVLFSKLLIIILLCAILKTIQDSFKGNIGEIAFYACYIFMIILVMESFKTVMTIGSQVVDAIVTFMEAIFPLLITMVGVSGSPTAAAAFNPTVSAAVIIISFAMKNIIIPMIFFYTVLNVINNISSNVKISNLCTLLKKTCEWSLGIILTGFVAVLSIQGVATSSFDGVAGKTTKFAIGNFVPVVGGMLSDAFDSVMSCSALIKNSISLFGILVVIAIVSIPLMKILVIILMYKLTAAVCQPIADSRMVKCLNEIGNSVSLIFVSVMASAFVFIVCLSIIIGVSSSGISGI